MWLLSNATTLSYQVVNTVGQSCVHSNVPFVVKISSKFWPTKNLSAIDSAKCRSEFLKLPLTLLHSAYRLDSSYELHYSFTWPVRHYPHSAMISTAHSISGPTALAVALAGRCIVRISLHLHLIIRRSVMTPGHERRRFYLPYLLANIRTAIPTAAQWTIILFLLLAFANTLCYIAADCQYSCRPSLCLYMYVYIFILPVTLLRKPKPRPWNNIKKNLTLLLFVWAGSIWLKNGYNWLSLVHL